MYESPIEILEGVTNHVMRETEDGIVCEVRKQLGVNIDKEELAKALKYDRGSYDKGYNDGQFAALSAIKTEIEWEYKKLRSTRADETLELGECLGLKRALKIIENLENGGK